MGRGAEVRLLHRQGCCRIHEHPHLFSAFQHALSSLSLSVVSVLWSVSVALVGYVPNFKNLNLLATSFQVDKKPIPYVSHPGRKWLFVDLNTGVSAGPLAAGLLN
jgi:hypothetical protein